ncbi:MAG: hypothetical protein LUD14_04825 [Clostridiales bacterium]|nr:hypothetical protein [Clostridiales bacterium]
MGRVMEEMRDEVKMRERKDIAVSLWNEGVRDVELIARSTKLTVEEVREAIGIKSA